jgi:hypothetical protein
MVVVASVLVVLAVLSGVAIPGPDKYTLRVPDGLAFSDFKGYEDWQLISSAKTDDRMKVILGNPTIIAAYTFPVDVPDTLADIFFMEKDSKKFPKAGGWAYAQFDYDSKSSTFAPDKAGTVACGDSCHVAVKAKDYVFHPYQNR